MPTCYVYFPAWPNVCQARISLTGNLSYEWGRRVDIAGWFSLHLQPALNITDEEMNWHILASYHYSHLLESNFTFLMTSWPWGTLLVGFPTVTLWRKWPIGLCKSRAMLLLRLFGCWPGGCYICRPASRVVHNIHLKSPAKKGAVRQMSVFVFVLFYDKTSLNTAGCSISTQMEQHQMSCMCFFNFMSWDSYQLGPICWFDTGR